MIQEISEAFQYGHDVLAGKIPTCELTFMAVARHFHDLENAHERGLYFDEEAALHAINFFDFLYQWDAEWAGQPFVLEPFQLFWTAVLFGWKHQDDGCRRFVTCYFEVARKNGKSTWVSGLLLYLFIGDMEPGAQIYTAATTKEQAAIIHRTAINIVEISPALKNLVKTKLNHMSFKSLNSTFVPLGRDSNTKDGFSPHGIGCDEFHEWPNERLYNVLDSACGARREPMILIITTAGTNRQGICYQKRTYTENVLRGIFKDDSHFGVIYTLDDDDDWQDEQVWIKSNPNYGKTVKVRDFKRQFNTAIQDPRSTNNFLTKRLNIWCSAEKRWIPYVDWESCASQFNLEDFKGRDCYVGIDLSKKIDLTSIAFVFPPVEDDPYWSVITEFYFPEDRVDKREKETKVPIGLWAEQGWITLTPGKRIDYSYVEDDILKASKIVNIRMLGYDPYSAHQFSMNMEEMGFTILEVKQTFRVLNEPTKEFEALVVEGRVRHQNDPCLNWSVSNVVTYEDKNGNRIPHKGKSTENIDGVAAILDGMYCTMIPDEEGGPSVYEEHGFESLC